MSTLSLRLPESIHKKVKELASEEGISINQFITTALAEKLSALLTLAYIEERGRKGSRAKYERVLRKVRDTSPEQSDELRAGKR